MQLYLQQRPLLLQGRYHGGRKAFLWLWGYLLREFPQEKRRQLYECGIASEPAYQHRLRGGEVYVQQRLPLQCGSCRYQGKPCGNKRGDALCDFPGKISPYKILYKKSTQVGKRRFSYPGVNNKITSKKWNLFLTDFARAVMMILRFKFELNSDIKLMTKRSTYLGRFTESCRWWDCGIQRDMEWTWEGGNKESETWVMPNGISARYQGKAHDGACGERVYFWYAKLGGTAEVESFCPSRDSRTGAFFMHSPDPARLYTDT